MNNIFSSFGIGMPDPNMVRACDDVLRACEQASRQVVALVDSGAPGWRGEAAVKEAAVRSDLVTSANALHTSLESAVGQARELERQLAHARQRAIFHVSG